MPNTPPGLLDSDFRFRALLEAAPDAMVIVDRTGQIVLVNAQAERAFGYERDELLGRPVEILVPFQFRDAHIDHRAPYAHATHARPMGTDLDLHGVRKDGSEFPAEISLSPLETEEGSLIVSAIRDITDRRAVEAERARLLHEQAAHAETSRIKDEFLATLSHELRTPLNAILGWTKWLQEASLGADAAAKALATIERNARAQAHLIEDLLDVSRIVGGNLRVQLQPIDVVQVVENAVDVVRPAAEAKSLALEVVAETRPVLMMGDPHRLQQAVWNLASNAVKFSSLHGRVEVRVWSAGQSIHIVVRDTGRGIAQTFLPHVFDRFRQAESSYTRASGGLGLGLSIVQSVVELHGGTVEATSAGEGQGAMFSIVLPIASEPVGAPADASRGGARELDRLDGVRILVVDDQPDERELLHAVLTRRGAEVDTAGSADEAIRRLHEWRPAVLITDIAMPDQDGYALLRRVRSVEGPLGRTPAVAVTAHAGAEDRKAALAAGFEAYVPKPIDNARLVRKLKQLAMMARVQPE